MKEYRLYHLDRFSGHIEEVEEFVAEDDDQATVFASGRNDGRAMELWHKHHKLRHWEEVAPTLQ